MHRLGAPLLVLLALAAPTLAQATGRGLARSPADARRAVVSLTVSDEALHEVLMLREGNVDQEALRRVRIHQPYILVMSGVAISENEVVTTALHPRADLRIIARLPDGSEARARLVGTDPRSGLALVELPDPMPAWLALDEVPVERLDAVDLVGQHGARTVHLRATVTCEHLNVWLHDLYGVNSDRPITLGSVFLAVGSAAQLNPGSACVRPDGRLAGLVIGSMGTHLVPDPEGAAGSVSMVEPEYVVPARRIERVVDQLRRHGRVVRAHFGMEITPVSDALRAQFDLPASAAAVVALQGESPAESAGVRLHDVVLAIEGRNYRDFVELGDAMSDRTPGEPVTLKLLRAGKPFELTVTPDER